MFALDRAPKKPASKPDIGPSHAQVCDEFEDACIAGRGPSLEEAIERMGPSHRHELFSDLLEIELHWRRMRGENLREREYEQRFPLFRDVISRRFSELPSTPSHALEVVTGPHAGRVFEFSRHETLMVGRDKKLQFPLPNDQHLSRHHCRLEISPPNARLVDLDSRNGTFVNRTRITQHDLQHGDRIRIGTTEIVHRLLTPRIPSPRLEPPTVLYETPAPIHLDDDGMPEWSPAEPIPGYELEEELGRGGLGQVFRARQRATGHEVAVKLILPAHAVDAEASKLFLREASLLSQLKHPRIVQFREMGISDGQLYLVMEYVPAIPFDELCRDMSDERRWKLACGIICRVLEGLSFAHARHVVHRDVKPANILISRNERNKVDVKLGDFGLAKNYLTAGFSGLTDDGAARGSLAFMPPEQIIDCRAAKPTCDLYATGITLFKYLTGHLPFETHTQASIMRAILEEPPPRADAIAAGIPRDLADFVERALAKQPRDRFRTAKDMRTALLPFASS